MVHERLKDHRQKRKSPALTGVRGPLFSLLKGDYIKTLQHDTQHDSSKDWAKIHLLDVQMYLFCAWTWCVSIAGMISNTIDTWIVIDKSSKWLAVEHKDLDMVHNHWWSMYYSNYHATKTHLYYILCNDRVICYISSIQPEDLETLSSSIARYHAGNWWAVSFIKQQLVGKIARSKRVNALSIGDNFRLFVLIAR